MIGGASSRLLYSGDENAYTAAEPALKRSAPPNSGGIDAGLASLKDMALLAAMDLMFLGYVQAFAMMRTAGTPAVETAAEVEAWLAAMLPHGKRLAAIVDGGTYDTGGQSVDFDRFGIGSLITASREQGIRADLLEPHQKLLEELAATGRGDSDWIRDRTTDSPSPATLHRRKTTMPKGTISVLGLGAMGSAIAERLRDTGYVTTVWNRTATKAEPHVKAGSKAAATVAEAAESSDIILVVLLDHASVQEHLDPTAADSKAKSSST